MVVFKIKTVHINIPVTLTVVLGILLLKEIALFLEEEKGDSCLSGEHFKASSDREKILRRLPALDLQSLTSSASKESSFFSAAS